MQSPRYRILLRSLYGAIIQSSLSAADLRALSEELRRGQLSDELSYLLDQALHHFQDPVRENSSELRFLEKLIKDRKIPKAALTNILRSIGVGLASSSTGTVRTMLQDFLISASPRQVENLKDILQSSGGSDPYLKGISDSNR